MPNGKYYAVAKGKQPGVYDNWDACKANVDKYSNNCYKKFNTPEAAGEFVRQNAGPSGNSGNGGSGGYSGGNRNGN